MIGKRSVRLMAASLLSCTALAAPLYAQSAPPPRYDNNDDTGVDLATGLVEFSMNEGSIGAGPGAISLDRIWAEGAGWVDNYSGGMYDTTINGSAVTVVQTGGFSDTFTKSGTTYTSQKANGSTLVLDATSGNYLYTASDGTKISFYNAGIEQVIYSCPGATSGTCRSPLTITRPNGLKFTLTFETGVICQDLPGEPCYTEKDYVRLQNVSSSAGYGVTFTYVSNSIGTPLPNASWFQRQTATFSNSVSPPSPAPVVNYAYPSSGVIDLTDVAGRTWHLTTTSAGLTGVRRPGSTSDDIVYAYGTDGKVSSATVNGVAYSYARTSSGSLLTSTVTDPLSQTRQAVADTSIGRMTSWKDELNRTTGFTYDANGRPTRVTQPEGNAVQLTYDPRGNVTEQRQVAKSGSGLADIVTTASYPSTCTNPVTCNKPTSTTDPRGAITDYTYDSGHGGVTSVTSPAPLSGSARPQTRITYSGVTSASGDVVQLPTSSSQCQTTASCAGTSDEVLATAAYNNQLQTTSMSRGNGAGTLTATQAMTYDNIGNMLTVDGPLAGTADMTRYRYDAARQVVGTVSPDPDGAGPLKNRAVRVTYRPDGLVSRQEAGNVNSQSDADWAGFTTNQTLDLYYDSYHRNYINALSSGSGTYALNQKSFDALGRVDCTALRMNTAAYGSLPSWACSLGTQGSQGPDRISRTVYDAASEPIQSITALGTSDQATDATLTYTANGKTQMLIDGENNRTTYAYDGFDRLTTTYYPLPSRGANASSTTDYEQLTYDVASKVTQFRARNGQTIGFSYDYLNRPISKGSSYLADVAYTYDLLGRPLTAKFTTAGQGTTNVFDALGRMTSTTSDVGGTSRSLSYLYDLAGRRTRITWWDGFYVDDDRLVTGELAKVRANGATSGTGVLATFGYDDQGRRTGLTRGNGTVTSYGYDPVSRLTSLTDDVAGTSSDQTVTFAYNPANQIAATTRSNDLYAWTGHGSGSTTSVYNGLNQPSSIGGVTTTSDANGNLTYDGSKTYAYDIENKLTSGGTATSFGYDPLNRLDRYSAPSTMKFIYDGNEVVAEVDGSGNIVRRDVRGDGSDELLVEYAGAGSTSPSWFHTDERGSVTALTDASGNVTAVNRYDEYGKPASTNVGRFQYTGQMWMSEAGLYNYKNRVYAPILGRFLQTDPIGTDGGINIYAYTGNDPVNATDPMGLLPNETVTAPTCMVGTLGREFEHYVCFSSSDPDRKEFRTPRTNETGGGGARSGNNAQRVNPCSIVAAQTGLIKYSGTTVSAVLLGGITRTSGTFTNLRTGSTGHYVSYGLSLGLGIGVGRTSGIYGSIRNFLGYSETLEGSASILGSALSAHAFVTQNVNNEITAGGAGVSVGAPLPLPAWANRAAVTATASDTSISQCTVGTRQ